ncbi:kinase-like domain-containing protein [Gongronella butleri]|nr:kinase-like domain-containing protein [Gongronella butleri]
MLAPVEPEPAAQVEKEMLPAPTANAIDTTTESKVTKNEPTRRERIQKEIDLLTETVEALRTDYKVVDRIGYGTFSTVYKCIDLKYNRYDNDDWTSHSENKPETQRHGVVATKKRVRYVALKQVYCTSSPKRMAHEISILQQLKGRPSIVQLITAFREGEHVFVVMPFFPSDDFKETYRSMTLNDTKHYLIEILTAVSHLHQLRIIHRDIKPNNFLYNIKKKKGVLIDFGLAQSEDEMRPLEPPKSSSSKTSSRPTHKLQRTSSSPGLMARSMSLTTAASSKLAATATATAPLATATTSAHHANSPASSPMATAAGTSASAAAAAAAALKKSPQSLHGSQPSAISSHTSPLSARSTNALDTDTKQRHGYYLHDPRKPAKANRAGTRGYRAPEVLLRVAHQTVAIDIWSVGVILFTLLTGRYPLFQAKDEADSLIEIASIFGMKEMKQCAAMHNRTFETNIETIPKLQRSLHKCCKVLNSQKYKHWLATDSVTLGRAIDLLEKMLVLDYTKRISAEDALKHPFLTN